MANRSPRHPLPRKPTPWERKANPVQLANMRKMQSLTSAGTRAALDRKPIPPAQRDIPFVRAVAQLRRSFDEHDGRQHALDLPDVTPRPPPPDPFDDIPKEGDIDAS